MYTLDLFEHVNCSLYRFIRCNVIFFSILLSVQCILLLRYYYYLPLQTQLINYKLRVSSLCLTPKC